MFQNPTTSGAASWQIGGCLKAQIESNSGNTTEVTFSVYDIKRDNILTQISQDEVSNISSQSSEGAEFAFSTDASNRRRVGGNAAYIDSKYDLFVDPDFGIDATGNRPPNVPEWVVNVWASISDVGGIPGF